MTEIDLCNIVKKSNLFPGYRLHEEVGISGVSCDIIYENGTDLYTIEAKKQLNVEVIAQAIRWQRVATASFIAVPVVNGYWNSAKKVVIETLGIGVIFVFTDSCDVTRADFWNKCNPLDVKPWENAPFYKFTPDWEYWKNVFDRIDKNVDAGSRNGDRSTTFSRTVAALKQEAEKHPKYTLDQLLLNVPTHYHSMSSAKNALKRYAKHGIITKFWKD